jgi:hypothetical protein
LLKYSERRFKPVPGALTQINVALAASLNIQNNYVLAEPIAARPLRILLNRASWWTPSYARKLVTA